MRGQLRTRLARFRDVLIRDGTVHTLVQSAADVYPATTDGEAGCKLHITESLERGVPTGITLTDAKTPDRAALDSVEWVENALVLLDLGYYDFSLFDQIDKQGGWFVSRLKTNANPLITEELRT